MQLVPGAAEFIESAALDGYATGHRVRSAAKGDRPRARPQWAAAHFEEIVAAEDVARLQAGSPGISGGPRVALALAPGRCVVIEDSLPGLAAARAAGLRCAMLSTSYDGDGLRRRRPRVARLSGTHARGAALAACLSSDLTMRAGTARGPRAARARRSCSRLPRPSRSREPGALTCLQGLLTNDLEKPGDARVVYGALLTPKGMIVVDTGSCGEGRLHLIAPFGGRDGCCRAAGTVDAPRVWPRLTDVTGQAARRRGCSAITPFRCWPSPGSASPESAGRVVSLGDGLSPVAVALAPESAPFVALVAGDSRW